MNKCIKIKVKYLMILGIFLIFACGAGGYYVWCRFHPDITIQISDSSAGENLKIEAPHVAISGRNGIEPAASVYLDITSLWIQHETVCRDLKDHYQTSDIKLNMEVKDGETVLNYSGTATTLKDEHVNFEKQVVLEFVLNADVTHK